MKEILGVNQSGDDSSHSVFLGIISGAARTSNPSWALVIGLSLFWAPKSLSNLVQTVCKSLQMSCVVCVGSGGGGQPFGIS